MCIKMRYVLSTRIFTCLVLVAAITTATPARGQCQRTKFNSDTGCCDELGWTVDIDGMTAVAASGHDADYDRTVRVYRLDGDEWEEEAQLGPDISDYRLVHDLCVAISGDAAVVGGWRRLLSFENSVFVYRRSGSQWLLEAELTAGDPNAYPNFGTSVAIDGDVVLVDIEGSHGAPETAAVMEFRCSAGVWERGQVLRPEDGGYFDRDIAISGGAVAVRGFSGGASVDDFRCVYMYGYNGSVWEQTQILELTSVANSFFIKTMDLTGDDLIVRSTEQHEDQWKYMAYIYHFDGLQWIQQAALNASEHEAGYGESCAINGNTALIGWASLDGGWPSDGEALIYQRVDSEWTPAGRLFAANGDDDEWFGASVALTDQHAIVGAPFGNYAAGTAYIFDLNLPDCNLNSWCDDIDIAEGWSVDFDGDEIPEECGCPGDLNGDRVVNLSDLAILLANYGAEEGMTHADGDLDFDGDVDLSDLAYLLGVYGDTCPYPA